MKLDKKGLILSQKLLTLNNCSLGLPYLKLMNFPSKRQEIEKSSFLICLFFTSDFFELTLKTHLKRYTIA